MSIRVGASSSTPLALAGLCGSATCGACAGYGSSIPEGSTVVSSTARNFKGRMGAATAQVYLGSPYTVAASAVRGAISDAREMLAGRAPAATEGGQA